MSAGPATPITPYLITHASSVTVSPTAFSVRVTIPAALALPTIPFSTIPVTYVTESPTVRPAQVATSVELVQQIILSTIILVSCV